MSTAEGSPARPGVLERIVARTRTDLLARAAAVPKDALVARAQPADRDFAAALTAPGLSLIAEIKHRSPSRGLIREAFDPAAIARIYDNAASAISVLTDHPHFGGRHEYLSVARANAARPLLAKDFFVDDYQIYEARVHGADALLLMASVLPAREIERGIGVARSLGMEPLVEVHSASELDAVLGDTSARIVGVNSRDLRTLAIDDSIVYELAPRVRAAGKIVVAESGIADRTQVDRLRDVADAVLVGTTIMQAPDIAARIRELGW